MQENTTYFSYLELVMVTVCLWEYSVKLMPLILGRLGLERQIVTSVMSLSFAIHHPRLQYCELLSLAQRRTSAIEIDDLAENAYSVLTSLSLPSAIHTAIYSDVTSLRYLSLEIFRHIQVSEYRDCSSTLSTTKD